MALDILLLRRWWLGAEGSAMTGSTQDEKIEVHVAIVNCALSSVAG